MNYTQNATLIRNATMNRFVLSASIFALSATAALAQNAPAGGAATAPRPATQAATPASAPSIPSAGVTIGKGTAATAAEARTAYTAAISAREAACKARGSTFMWSPAHQVGDANPKGGFFAKPSNGSCREMTLKKARELGLVTVR
jgi:hypothetical protein